jgi:hypothetical protein
MPEKRSVRNVEVRVILVLYPLPMIGRSVESVGSGVEISFF